MKIETKHDIGDVGFYATSAQNIWRATLIGIECDCSGKCINIWYKVFIPAFNRVRRIPHDSFYLSKAEALKIL